MKRQKYPASVIKVGAVLYTASGVVWDGKTSIDVNEWVVRSIQCKRGTKSKFGFKNLYPEDTAQFVNVTQRVDGITWGKLSAKTGDFGWKKSIPAEYRDQFKVGSELPNGFYTTKLQALKYALVNEQDHIKWYEAELKNPESSYDKQELEIELAEAKLVAKALLARITREKNKK